MIEYPVVRSQNTMYKFYLGDTQLPVAPSSMEIKINNKNDTLTLINEGEINKLKTAGLTDITFDIPLPGKRYPWAQYPSNDFVKPTTYLDVLEKFKTSRKPFDFVVVRAFDMGFASSDRTNMSVSLESYTIKENAGNGKDYEVEIKLKQYKEFGTKVVTIKKETVTAEPPRAAPASTTTNYTVAKGDTLWGIAKKKLGNATKWPTIYSFNKDLIEATAKKYGKSSSSNGHWIYPGTVLKIPNS